ncbi:hypothetical protein ACFLXV_03090 [Chloroflexota bacterium]
MFTVKGRVEELFGRKFSIVKNGLDEVEVSSFIANLINQNSDLAKKLQCFKSSAEPVGQIERITAEAEQSMAGGVQDTIASAAQRAREIIKAAEKRAEAIKGSATIEAVDIITDVKQKSDAAERQAQQILEEAAGKVESIQRLAEEEAGKLISEVRSKARMAANAEAERLIAEAARKAEVTLAKLTQTEQQARDIIATAEKETEASKRQVQEEAREIIAEAKLKSDVAERQAEQILAEAVEKAESMKDLAEQEASRLISEVKQRAERSAELKIAQAEDEGRRIIEEAVKTAEMEAQRIKGEAGQTLQMSQNPDTDRIQERFDKYFDEFPSGAADTGRSREIPADRTQVENKEELALYGGTVELAIRPPITLDRIVKLHRHLRGSPQVQVLNVERSADKGLKMRLLLRDRTPLLDVLKTLPEVKKVSTLQPADSNKAYAQGTGTKDNVQRIVVTTRE